MRDRLGNRRGLIAAAGAIVLVVGAAGVAIIYLVIFPGAAPRKLALSLATATPSTTSAAAATVGAGTYSVASGSQVGYRVREQLAFIGAPSDAVGRTSVISGSLTLTQTASGYSVTAASFTVDVSTLTSDRTMRDQRLHSIGLESDRYPKASFTLAEPIALPATAGNGQTIHVSATGALTIHGVTKTVTLPIDARETGSQVELVGSITFPFSEFGMTPPSIGGFVSVQDSATMEFQLNLKPSGT